MSQYFKGSGPFDFFAPLGTHLLNFFGNIARAVPWGYHAAAVEALAGTPEVAAAGAPPARVPAAMPWPENLMDCAVLSVKYRGLCRGERMWSTRDPNMYTCSGLC